MTRNKRNGFTLVELLVAITLFAIAISVAIGGFTRALRTQRQLIALIAANSNASLAIEQMAREIRTGRNFECAGATLLDCDGSAGLVFNNADGQKVTYALTDEVLTRTVDGGATTKVTADNVRIRYLEFLLNNPQSPGRVTINLGVGVDEVKMPELVGNVTNIETTISSRAF